MHFGSLPMGLFKHDDPVAISFSPRHFKPLRRLEHKVMQQARTNAIGGSWLPLRLDSVRNEAKHSKAKHCWFASPQTENQPVGRNTSGSLLMV